MATIIRLLLYLLSLMTVYDRLIEILYDILKILIPALLSCHGTSSISPREQLSVSQILKRLGTFVNVADIIFNEVLNDIRRLIDVHIIPFHIDQLHPYLT